MEFLGSAAFSKAVQALDLKTNQLVCLKIVNNNKDYFDQSLDEIKLLQYINEADPEDDHNLLRLFDYFYYKVRAGGLLELPCAAADRWAPAAALCSVCHKCVLWPAPGKQPPAASMRVPRARLNRTSAYIRRAAMSRVQGCCSRAAHLTAQQGAADS